MHPCKVAAESNMSEASWRTVAAKGIAAVARATVHCGKVAAAGGGAACTDEGAAVPEAFHEELAAMLRAPKPKIAVLLSSPVKPGAPAEATPTASLGRRNRRHSTARRRRCSPWLAFARVDVLVGAALGPFPC